MSLVADELAGVLLVEDDPGDALHANGYIVKPVGLDDFVEAIKMIDACFLRLIEPSLPGDQPDPQHPVLDI